jgi:hypothetical protein
VHTIEPNFHHHRTGVLNDKRELKGGGAKKLLTTSRSLMPPSDQGKRSGNCAEEGIYDSLELKLARTGTEVLSVDQRPKGVDTREADTVSAPVDVDAPSSQGEEDDQSGDSEGGAEGSGGDAERLSARSSQSGVGEVTH